MPSEITRADLDKVLEMVRQSSSQEDLDFVASLDSYVATGDESLLPLKTGTKSGSWSATAGIEAALLHTTDDLARKMAEIAMLGLARRVTANNFITTFFNKMVELEMKQDSGQLIALAQSLGIAPARLATLIAVYCHPLDFGWTTTRLGAAAAGMSEYSYGCAVERNDRLIGEQNPPRSMDFTLRIERLFSDLDDAALSQTLVESCPPGGKGAVPATLIGAVALFRPQAAQAWIRQAATEETATVRAWQHILKATARWDPEFLAAMPMQNASDRLVLLLFHRDTGRPSDQAAALAAAMDPSQSKLALAFDFLAGIDERAFEQVFRDQLSRGKMLNLNPYAPAFEKAARRWTTFGKAIFDLLPGLPYRELHYSWQTYSIFVHLAGDALTGLLAAGDTVPGAEVRDWFQRMLDAITTSAKQPSDRVQGPAEFWAKLAASATPAVFEDLLSALGSSSKTLRTTVIPALKKFPAAQVVGAVLPKLTSRKADERLGAAELLGVLTGDNVTEALEKALAAETSDKVRTALHEALKGRGAAGEETPATQTLEELEARYAAAAKKLKLPAAKWLDLAKLPPPRSATGTPVSPATVAFLISKQAAIKTIAPSADILPLLAHLDRATSAPFAAALVDGFLNSEQAAGDRWALTLGGLLGDQRVIPPLLARIHGWCENSRHKLAEYAAQAISLLPGNEPLMVLDTLANRYRSKFKNVGKACGDAFAAAAKARGITPDELGDMVVPDFGFDAEGVRAFTWPGGGASAELGADFKLTWFDPGSEKTRKTLPASAPAEIQSEVKTLAKLLRETVKAQTPRLEMALVRQRRWPVARWRELYETHPLLRSFASQLVWGIYAASGSLLRTFRRYPNGLLADAAGGLEEIPETDAQIGIVHPLELSGEALQAWRGHLARFKVKPPFSQIDRPVEKLDPLHGNRREVALTKGKKLGAGTFRSRAEKRGWARGSVVDGGAIFSYYKAYPGAGHEAVLRLDFFGVGFDPMEEIELGAAYFITAGSVERASYTYDELSPDDPRVLRFDAVPAVVWSETLSDLKAILGETSSPTP